VLKSLASGDPLSRIQLNHRGHKFQLVPRERVEHRLRALCTELRERHLVVLELGHPWPGDLCRSPVVLEDLEDLVDLAVAHEERALRDQLGEDAADRPHIDPEGVGLLAQ